MKKKEKPYTIFKKWIKVRRNKKWIKVRKVKRKQRTQDKVELTAILLAGCQADLDNLHAQFVVEVTHTEFLCPEAFGC